MAIPDGGSDLRLNYANIPLRNPLVVRTAIQKMVHTIELGNLCAVGTTEVRLLQNSGISARDPPLSHPSLNPSRAVILCILFYTQLAIWSLCCLQVAVSIK